ncbi:DNA repair protein RadC [Variovorax sp. PBS-H4]|uniref:PLxRFG domain-containing protein n=1 Tax=Variovorax sp. PBS-H4 TaxID=434008 RepID=UPI0013178C6A|nr:PLxRFG domain-containing protein [Variovorax sp. PBS-H4]VTU38223.1 DNA repair protein RadC [Variovorax sp. PBS-H4]
MNINEIRAQEPDWANLDDQQIVRVLHEVHYPDMSPEQIAKAIGAKEPAAPVQPRSWARVAGDVGVSALKGAIGVPEAAVGLADIATGGRAGKFLENEDGAVGFRPKQAKTMLDELYSDQQKQAFKAVNDAEGFGGKFVAALENPSVVGHSVVESLPSMAAGGVVARGVGAVAPRVAGAFGGASGAAIGEGVVGAGSAAEQIRQETPGGTMTAGQAGLAAATGVATSAFGLLGGKVAKSLGINDVDMMLAGAITSPAKAKGIVRRVLEGAASEGILEELPQSISEQVLQNLALGKPLDEGVDQAAVLGLLSGAAMGGGANVLHGRSQQPAANDPSDTAVPAANDPLALPAPTITVGPDGTAQTVDQRQGVRDDLEARAGQIVEKGPLARAAQAATGAVIDVEAKPAGALAKASASINPVGVPSESASNQAPADEVGEQLPGAGGAELSSAATPVQQPGMADGMAESVLAEGAPVGADQAAEPAGIDAPPAAVEPEPAAEPLPPPVYATYEEADAYRKAQKSSGSSITGLPVATEGGFRLATKNDPEYAEGERLREERRIAKERADAGMLDGDITNAKGKPFTIRLPAINALKTAGPGHEIVPVKGGFVVRKSAGQPESTDAKEQPQAADPQPAPVQATAAPAKSDEGAPFAGGEAATVRPGADAPAAPAAVTPSVNRGEVVEHTTGRGRVLRGVWRPDLTKEQAEAIDPSTWNVKGKGFFIREAHLEQLPPVAAPSAKSDAPAPAPTGKLQKERDESPVVQFGRALVAAGMEFDGNDPRDWSQHVGERGEIHATMSGGRNGSPTVYNVRSMLDGKDTGETMSTIKLDDVAHEIARQRSDLAERESAAPAPDVKEPLTTAAPAPLYSQRKLTPGSVRRITEWAQSQGFTDVADDLHVTVGFSRTPVDASAVPLAKPTTILPGTARSVQRLGDEGAVVLMVESRVLDKDHKALRDAGASWDFPGYQPHVTITYNPGAVDLSKVVPFQGPIDLMGEERRPLKADPTPAEKPADSLKTQDSPAGKSGVSSKSEPAAPAASANTIFTEDAAAAARARMKAKLGRLNSGIDPELLQDGITLAGYHIERGARTFAAYAKAMLEDMGEGIRPYLKQLYMALKFDPRATALEGLDTAAAVEAANLDSIAPAAPAADTGAPKDGNAARELDSPSTGALAGAPTEDVRPTGEGGQARAGADGSRGGDGGRNPRADDAGRDVAGSVGAGPRDVSVPAGGTGPGAQDAKKPRLSRPPRPDARPDGVRPQQSGLTPEGGPNEAPNAPPIAAPQIKAEDFTIEDDLGVGEGGQKTKYRNNIAAIRLLNELEAGGRLATPDEQRVLAKYVGWGGLPQAFDPKNADWSKEHAELTSLLSPQDLADARRSTRYAHYTSRPIIVDGIYAALRRFGFTGGKTLEAGAGVGNFIGLMPADMRSAGRFTAIEREPFSSAIAKHLYPRQIVQRADFTEFKGNDAYFDAAVGNPPFASDTQTDRSGRKHLSGLSLHNYFFAKAVDMLREGGVMAQVVTNSFLDAKTDSARKYISDRTVFLGAIRLPNSAFAKNANTEVTTDIIFLQKRPDSDIGSKAAKQDAKRWLNTGLYADRQGKAVALNQYFIDNPGMMLGDYGAFGTMYGPDQPALVARPGQDTLALLKEAVGKLPEGVYKSIADTGSADAIKAAVVALKSPTVQEGGFFLEGDKLMQRLPDLGGEARGTEITPSSQWTEKTKLGDSGFARIKALAGMRSTLRGLIAAEMADDDKGMGQLRATLNDQYDAYRKEHGLINDPSTLRVFDDDPDFPLLASLEHGYTPGIGPAAAKRQGIKPTKSTAKKGPIFERRVVAARSQVRRAETAADALAVSMAERGKLDAAYIGKILSRDPEDVLRELSTGDKPLLFRDPATDEFVLRDAYLSGNVRAKLAQARSAGMSANVRALEEVQPEDVGASQIVARVGSPWVPEQAYEQFAAKLFGDGTKARVRYMKLNSSYQVDITPANDVAWRTTWGTAKMNGGEILTALLNNRAVKVTYRDSDGKTHTDADGTEQANTKAQEIREAFGDWLFSDADRSEKLVRAYNDTNNNYVTRVYDGSMMTFPGKVPDMKSPGDGGVTFRRHQRNAIARMVQDRTTLFDHVVGAGKTYTVVAGSMELKRTGLASKPMIAVPNHLVKQWAADFYRLYPGANILTATKKDFERANRRKFLAKIATGDWDAVVIAHSSFGFIKPAPEFEAAFNQREIDNIVATIKAVEGGDGDKPQKKRTVKQLEALKEKLENRIKALRDKPMDDLLDFEQLGVDQLAVDEFHMFKNLMFSTKMQNVQGLGDSAGSQRAYDMYVKINQIYAKNGRDQGFVAATGTPVSNSLAEMYHMMRYLMPTAMKELGFESFDAWANTFASVEQVWMQKPSGEGFKASSRMSNFVNTPELLKMFDQVCDTVTMEDIKSAYREENDGAEFPLPKVKGGRRTPISLDKTPAQETYMQELAERAKILEARKGPPQKGEDNILVIMGDGRKAAMDIRLVDIDRIEREVGGRVDRASDEILTRYQQYAAVKGTQLVFSDLGTPIKHAKAELKEYEALRERVAAANEDVQASATLGNEAALAIVEDAEAAQEALDAKGPDWLDAVKAAERGFSVYDDLRAALIEKGIPAEEIAFIHDYNTDDQKASLFRKVNAGEIRVLVGSTAKMGAGTNVQERLVALHHLDVPWRPSDVEQREGRIERQGNVLMNEIAGFEVEILAYVTKDTLDMRMWQVQETKLKMINQLRTRKVGREIDNAFEDLELSAGEMQAAATGNIDLLHEIQLRADVKKLEQRKRSFDANKNELESRRRRNAERLAELPEKISAGEPIAAQVQAYAEDAQARLDQFKATIDGTEYTNWREAQAHLRAKDEAKVKSKDKEGNETERAAPIDVEINGERYTARAPMAEAFSDLRGDVDPIVWNVGGEEYRRRTRIASAIKQGVIDSIADQVEKPVGTIAGFDVKVEATLDKAGTVVMDVTLSQDGKVIASRDLYVTDTGKAPENVVASVSRMLESLRSDQDWLKSQLGRAKKEKADLDATEEMGTWPEQGKLEQARLKHKEVLQRLAGKGDKASAEVVARSNEAEYDPANGNPDQAAPEASAGDQAGAGAAGVRGDSAAVQRRATVTGLGIAAELEEARSTALVGRKASTPEELAELAQVYRNPKYETFRVFFMKGDEIVHSTGVSARMPGYAPMVPAGMNTEQYFEWFYEEMQRTGADGYYLLHNHPSGDPTPSPDDLRLTDRLGNEVGGLRAHVIINSGKYATIELSARTGLAQPMVHTKDFGPDKVLLASKPNPLLGKAIGSLVDLAVIGKSAQKPGWITLIGTDASNNVRVVTEAPSAILTRNHPYLKALVRRTLRNSGATRVFLVGSDVDMGSPAVIAAVEAGVVEDALGDSGVTLRGTGTAVPTNPGRRAFDGLKGHVVRSPDTPVEGLNDVREWRAKASDIVGDLFKSKGVVGWWHKTVGTMHDLAQRRPAFRRVYDAVQTFLQDVSLYATEAADLAPNILPKLETWRDLKKGAMSLADTKALAAPVFEGTLTYGRDQDGRLVKMADLEGRYAALPTEEKAQMLLRKRLVTPEQLQRWQASKIDVYEGAVRNRFEAEFLKAGVVFTDAELKATFGLNGSQIGLYREFRAAVDNSLNNLGKAEMLRFGGKDTEALRQMVLDAPTADDAAVLLRDHLLQMAEDDEARAEVLRDTANTMIEKGDKIKSLIDRGYAPLSRYGSYTVDVVDADGERVHFGLYESRLDRGAAARRLREQFPGATVTMGTVSQQAYKLFNGITPETLEMFGEMVGLEADGDEAKHQMFQQYLKLAKSNRSAMKRLIERKGIAGYSEDPGRVLAGFVYSNARLTSQNLHAGEISRATEAIPKEDGELKDMAIKLGDYVRNPQEEAQGLRGLLFAQYIGGSIASALVNMTQPFAVTMPYLSQYGGITKSATRMKQALADVMKKTTGDAKLDAALKQAEAEGIVAPQEVHQLIAQARGSAALKTGDGTRWGDLSAGAQNLGSKVMVAWGKPFSLAEQFNRRVTFIAAYRTAVEQGIANPAKFAEKAIADTQFVYNKGNKPQWARGAAGSVIFTFKQYSISYAELLHRMATQGGPEGRKAALFALAMLFLLSGAGGIPFMSDAEDVIDGIMQRLGYAFSTKQARRQFFINTLGEGGAEFAERGISGFPGVPIDVAGRLGMGNLLPGTGLFVKKADHARDVAELLGPAADLVQRGYEGAGKVLDGDVVQGGTMMAPKAAENLRKGIDMWLTGEYKDSKGRKVMDVNPIEAAVKAIGFQPADVAREGERTFTTQAMVAQNRLAKQDFSADMAKAVYEKDFEQQKAVRDAVREWNRKNPHSPMTIDMAGVRRRVMAMRQDRATRVANAAPKAVRQEVKRQLQEGAN